MKRMPARHQQTNKKSISHKVSSLGLIMHTGCDRPVSLWASAVGKCIHIPYIHMDKTYTHTSIESAEMCTQLASHKKEM